MKILILAHFFGRGSRSSLTSQFKDRGYQATILATKHIDCLSDNADFLIHKQQLSCRLTVLRLLERIQEIQPDVVYPFSGTAEMKVLHFLHFPSIRHFSS